MLDLAGSRQWEGSKYDSDEHRGINPLPPAPPSKASISWSPYCVANSTPPLPFSALRGQNPPQNPRRPPQHGQNTSSPLPKPSAQPTPSPNSSQSQDYTTFPQNPHRVFTGHLSKLVVRDGEGATKFVNVRFAGSPSIPSRQTKSLHKCLDQLPTNSKAQRGEGGMESSSSRKQRERIFFFNPPARRLNGLAKRVENYNKSSEAGGKPEAVE